MKTQRWQIACWLGAVVVFAIGSYVGWTLHAQAGAILWGISAVLGFLPFLSHRNAESHRPR